MSFNKYFPFARIRQVENIRVELKGSVERPNKTLVNITKRVI